MISGCFGWTTPVCQCKETGLSVQISSVGAKKLSELFKSKKHESRIHSLNLNNNVVGEASRLLLIRTLPMIITLATIVFILFNV